ncbi:MAG: Na+/H+ antiporter NhaC family protein [Oscillospiraceae bacterium]
MDTSNVKPNGWALLPILVFLVLFVGMGVVAGSFYSMPAVVAFLIALVVAFFQNKKLNFNSKMHVVAESIGDDNIITMCLIFLAAGGFSGAVTAAGGASSTVNLGLSLLPPSVAVVGLFIIGCFISISMGTSMGTIAVLAPMAVEIAQKTGFALPICIAAVVCGAMFGDNLSMISDTTIAAVRTQGCDMKDKFKANFLIVLPAALVTIGVFFLLTMHGNTAPALDYEYNLLRVLPYLLVLVGALIGINVFVVLIGGTVISVIIGVFTGAMPAAEIFSSIGGGVTGMYDITVISILVAAISGLVRANGGFAFLLHSIKKRIKKQRGAELGIAALVSVTDLATANNTIAIVLAGPIAKEISDEYGVEPKRSASLLDIFASVFQGIIPYGAQILSASELTALTPFAIMPYLVYPYLMALSALAFIIAPSKKRKAADAARLAKKQA